jgi:APA family basic amino acid/polyamine antiporter
MKMRHSSSRDAVFGAGVERKLGVPICTALVVGNMVGAGIFLLPAPMAAFGVAALQAWGLSCLAALALAFVMARLSRRMGGDGGPILFTYRAFGSRVGTLVAWCYWLSLVIGNAAVAVALAGYVARFFPAVGLCSWAPVLLACSCIWLLTGINARSTYDAGRLQLVSTVLKLIPLIVLVLAALPHLEMSYMLAAPRREVDLPTLGTLAAVAFWAFVGLESATVSRGVIDRPERTIPRATVIGTLIACVLYMLVMTVALATTPASLLVESSSPLSVVALRVMGPRGETVVSLAGIMCMFSALNGFILITGYLGQAAAVRGMFPAAMGRVSGPMHTPRNGLVVAAVVSSVVVVVSAKESLFDEFALLCALATAAMVVPYVMSCLAEPVLLLRARTVSGLRGLGVAVFNLLVVLCLVWAFVCVCKSLAG